METAAVNDAAWPILLQHDSIRAELRVAARLICCSKDLVAAVAEHSTGRLTVGDERSLWYNGARQREAERWVVKHARLLLELNTWFCSSASLRALSAAAPQLHLQALETGGPASFPLLERLPAHRLTRLRLALFEVLPDDWDRPPYAACVSAAISRLTALQLLQLGWNESSLELPGLSALTRLTRLVCDGPSPSLQHLPAQLLQLGISDDGDEERGAQQALDLRHLTALTALNHQPDDQISLSVVEGDVMPPTLVQLCVSICRSVQPLLGLQKLQVLDVGFEPPLDITAQQLAACSSLTSLRLSFEEATEPASAAAWPLLPLKRLRLRKCRLPAAACRALGQVTGLTSLLLNDCGLADSAAQQQLVATLSRLSRLQELDLNFSIPCRISSTPQLWQAIGSLRGLCCLFVSYVEPVEVSALSSLVALTKLELEHCGLSDAAVCAGLAQLSGLVSLSVGNNQSLTDVALPVIGLLRQLTELRLANAGVKDAGLPHLAGLRNLRALDLCFTGVSDAGLPMLAGMTHLQQLDLLSFSLTQEDKAWLCKQLPATRVAI